MAYENENNFLQFELWKDCKNHCKFCFNKGLKDIEKAKSLDFVLDKLEDIGDANELGIIGGEFFDDQLNDKLVHDKFMQVQKKMQDYVLVGKVKKIYITTSMLFNNLDSIFEVLNSYKEKKILDKLLLCTSYDTIYRFKDIQQEKLWRQNVKQVKQNFPEIMLHVETIMTQDFISKVLDGSFDIAQFKKELDVEVDYLEPNTGSFYDGKEEFNKHLPNFLPKRKDFIKFLKKTCIVDKTIPLFKLFSKNIRSDTIYLIVNGEHVKIECRRKSSRLVGLYGKLKILPRFGYIDSNVDIAEDVKLLRSMYNG